MSSSSVRAFPPAAALAFIGGAAGLLALVLPWFAFEPEGLLQLAKALGVDTTVAQQSGMSADQVQQALAAQLSAVDGVASDALVGYKLFSPISVVLQAVAAAGAIYAGLRMIAGEQPSALGGPLVGAAFVVGGRAVYGLLQMPGERDLRAIGATNLLTPAIGLWLALAAGAALVAAAAAASMQGAATTGAEWVPPAGGVPGGAHVPGGVTSQTPVDAPPVPGYAASSAPSYGAPSTPSYAPPPVTAYAPPPASPAYPPAPAIGQPAAAYAPPPTAHADTYAGAYVPQPATYQPGMAYGDEGPSSLDNAKNAPRAIDPYAPKRALSPEAMPPAPPTAPAHHAPVAPIRPAPLEAPPQPGPPRGSVAPPGVG